MICPRCDRGNVYCGAVCAVARRDEAQRDAGERYQSSRVGRFKHAARQAAYRGRLRTAASAAADPGAAAFVTHQGPPIPGTPTIVVVAADAVPNPGLPCPPEAVRCSLCGCPCLPFARSAPLRVRRRDRLAGGTQRGPPQRLRPLINRRNE